jgi:hypothetical protein
MAEGSGVVESQRTGVVATREHVARFLDELDSEGRIVGLATDTLRASHLRKRHADRSLSSTAGCWSRLGGATVRTSIRGAVVPPSDAELAALDDFGDSLEVEVRDAHGVERFVDGLSGAGFRHRLAFEPSFNIAGISTGYRGAGMKTVTPSRASAWFDYEHIRLADIARTIQYTRST